MNDLETLLSDALRARAAIGYDNAAHVRAEATVIHIGTERTPLRRGRAIVAAASGLVVAATAAALVVGAARVSHTPSGSTGHGAAAGASRAAGSPYGIPRGHFLLVSHDGQFVWIPPDITATWRLLRPGGVVRGGAVDEQAPCAAFSFYGGASGTCTAALGWQYFRPQFTESLPSDPEAVLRSIYAAVPAQDSAQQRSADAFSIGSKYLGMGVVSDHAARTIEAALKLIPGVHATSILVHPGEQATSISEKSGRGELIEIAAPTNDSGTSKRIGLIVDPVSGRVGATVEMLTGKSTVVKPINYRLVTSLT